MGDVAMLRFEESLGLVKTTWAPLDRVGRRITTVDTTDTLRGACPQMKIVAVMPHDEECRRTPLVAPTAARRGG